MMNPFTPMSDQDRISPYNNMQYQKSPSYVVLGRNPSITRFVLQRAAI